MKNQLIALVFILNGCYIDSTQNAREWNNQFQSKPYTIKEKEYLSQLNKSGFFNAKIESPYIGVVAKGLSSYKITLYTKKYQNDSLNVLSRNVASDLYYNVIGDSILNDIGQIRIYIYSKSGESDKSYSYFNKNFAIKDFRNELGKNR